MQNSDGYQPGDKVRFRSGSYAGTRGILRGEEDSLLHVELTSGAVILASPEELTNFSLAARRAWETMPKRAGRPPASSGRKKMVSIRLDIDVWRQLGQAAELGLIVSREQAVNVWLQERLDEILLNRPYTHAGSKLFNDSDELKEDSEGLRSTR